MYCVSTNEELFLRLSYILGVNSFIMDLWGDKSDPFIQALCLFFGVGAVLCVQVAKQFLACRPTDSILFKTNSSENVFGLYNSTNVPDMVHEVPISFQSDYEIAYYILGAFCIVGAVVQIVSWVHSGNKLCHLLPGQEGKIQSPSLQSSQLYEHNQGFFVAASFILCFIAFLGSAIDETFGAFGMSFTVHGLDWTTSDASNLITVYSVSLFVCNCVSIIASQFVQVNVMMIVSIVIGVSGAILMASVVNTTELSLWIGASLLGLGFGNYVANTLNASMRLTEQSSIISSVIFSSIFVCRIVAPQVIGYLLDHEDPMWFLYLVVVYTSLALMMSVLFPIVLFFWKKCFESFGNGKQDYCGVPLETTEAQEDWCTK